MQREAGAHLWDAAEAARLVHEFARGKTEADSNSDLVIRSAIERQLEILGEALNRLRRDDADTAARVPDLDKVVGMRNIIAHVRLHRLRDRVARGHDWHPCLDSGSR